MNGKRIVLNKSYNKTIHKFRFFVVNIYSTILSILYDPSVTFENIHSWNSRIWMKKTTYSYFSRNETTGFQRKIFFWNIKDILYIRKKIRNSWIVISHRSVLKELSICHKIKFSNPFIFPMQWCKHLIFQTLLFWYHWIHS